jgi:hypothetical protein
VYIIANVVDLIENCQDPGMKEALKYPCPKEVITPDWGYK